MLLVITVIYLRWRDQLILWVFIIPLELNGLLSAMKAVWVRTEDETVCLEQREADRVREVGWSWMKQAFPSHSFSLFFFYHNPDF